MQNSIEIKGLSVSYRKKRVLTNINLKVKPSTLTGVIGPNGAGKSSLFKAILGLVEYDTGDIKVLGKEIDEVRKRLAYVPQKDEVDWSFPATVQDIVLMGRYPHTKLLDRLKPEDYTIAEEAMEKAGILDLRKRQIGALSGGQQQRVFLARALCQQAEILFLDEPFVGVDITTEEKIIQILQELAEEGKTLLVVHHDLSTVEKYFDACILLNGRLIASGDTKTTFTKENMAKTYGSQLTILHKTGMLK